MATLDNHDFRKFLVESKPAAAHTRPQIKKKKKEKQHVAKEKSADDPDVPKYRCARRAKGPVLFARRVYS
jgi:hypothetical protein